VTQRQVTKSRGEAGILPVVIIPRGIAASNGVRRKKNVNSSDSSISTLALLEVLLRGRDERGKQLRISRR